MSGHDRRAGYWRLVLHRLTSIAAPAVVAFDDRRARHPHDRRVLAAVGTHRDELDSAAGSRRSDTGRARWSAAAMARPQCRALRAPAWVAGSSVIARQRGYRRGGRPSTRAAAGRRRTHRFRRAPGCQLQIRARPHRCRSELSATMKSGDSDRNRSIDAAHPRQARWCTPSRPACLAGCGGAACSGSQDRGPAPARAAAIRCSGLVRQRRSGRELQRAQPAAGRIDQHTVIRSGPLRQGRRASATCTVDAARPACARNVR